MYGYRKHLLVYSSSILTRFFNSNFLTFLQINCCPSSCYHVKVLQIGTDEPTIIDIFSEIKVCDGRAQARADGESGGCCLALGEHQSARLCPTRQVSL